MFFSLRQLLNFNKARSGLKTVIGTSDEAYRWARANNDFNSVKLADFQIWQEIHASGMQAHKTSVGVFLHMKGQQKAVLGSFSIFKTAN